MVLKQIKAMHIRKRLLNCTILWRVNIDSGVVVSCILGDL